MKKKFLFVLLFTFVIFFLGAEEQDNANINENLSFQELFENSTERIFQNERLKKDTEQKGVQPIKGGYGSQYQSGGTVILRNGKAHPLVGYAHQAFRVF